MNKRFLIISVLAMVFIAGATIYVSAQASSEVTAIYLFNAMPVSGLNGTVNTCMAGSPSPCLEADGGYAPSNPGGGVASNVRAMSSMVSGVNTYWNPVGSYQCVQSFEVCDAVTGELMEVVCGSAVGMPNAAAFNAAFPNNFWSSSGEPVALMRVNCATYAANNPALGLTGVCSAGACI